MRQRDRDNETERQRDRETERQRDKETERQRDLSDILEPHTHKKQIKMCIMMSL